MATKRTRSTSAAQLLLFSQPAALAAGLGRADVRRRIALLTAQLNRKFGPGWETRSDEENAMIEYALEKRRERGNA